MPYPDGMPSMRRCVIDMHCLDCEHEFEVDGYHDLGQYFTYSDDESCPQCGSDNTECS